MTPETLTEALQQQFGPALKSVILYGSAAAGDYLGKRSDYNVLVVVDPLGVEPLRAFSEVARRWVKAGNPPPLFFTSQRLRASTDVFPIEFADMKDAHRVLYGEDAVADLQIDPRHLRLQLEREFQSKLLQLRERYLVSAPQPREVRELLIESLSSFMVLARAALHLWQPQVPANKLEAVRALTKHIPFDVGVFERIHAWKAAGPSHEDPHAVFANYLHALETIADAVDVFIHNGGESR